MTSLSNNLYSKYKILEEPKLVLEFYRGVLTLPLMKNYVRTLVSDPNYNMQIYLLTDIRELIYDGNIQEVKEYAEFLIGLGEKIGYRKTAVVYKTPNQFAYASFFVKLHEQLPHQIKLFNNREDAISWLQLNKHAAQIQNSFAEMEHSLCMA